MLGKKREPHQSLLPKKSHRKRASLIPITKYLSISPQGEFRTSPLVFAFVLGLGDYDEQLSGSTVYGFQTPKRRGALAQAGELTFVNIDDIYKTIPATKDSI